MEHPVEEIIQWNPDMLLEISLPSSEDFLRVKETLTRIGISSKKEQILYQSCHILQKKGKYYLVHFKEMFLLDEMFLPSNKKSFFSKNDLERRNTIAQLLSDWGLIDIINKSKIEDKASIKQIKIIPFKDKANWVLCQKYTIGKKPN